MKLTIKQLIPPKGFFLLTKRAIILKCKHGQHGTNDIRLAITLNKYNLIIRNFRKIQHRVSPERPELMEVY